MAERFLMATFRGIGEGCAIAYFCKYFLTGEYLFYCVALFLSAALILHEVSFQNERSKA